MARMKATRIKTETTYLWQAWHGCGVIGLIRRPREIRLLDLAQVIIDWQPIIRAPFERDLEVAVINPDGTVNALGFPCWRTFDGWLNEETKKWLDVRPTHWRNWAKSSKPDFALSRCSSASPTPQYAYVSTPVLLTSATSSSRLNTWNSSPFMLKFLFQDT